jgi:hypothetical protein
MREGEAEYQIGAKGPPRRPRLSKATSRRFANTRLTSVGYGQEKPVADNRSEEGRAKNRRVELVKK